MGFAIQLKVHDPSPYSQLKQVLTKQHIVVYCNDFYDMIVLEDKITPDLVDQIQGILQPDQPIAYDLNEVDPLKYIIVNSRWKTTKKQSLHNILSNQGIQLSPPLYIDEWEYHKFLCIKKSNISKILEDMRQHFEIEILSIEENTSYNPLDFIGLTPTTIHQNLSDAQVTLLVEAFKEGYYQIPRNTKLAEIAKSKNKSRYSVERAIRNAEKKVMEMVVPLIDLETNLHRMRFNMK